MPVDLELALRLAEYFERKYSFLNAFPLNSDRVPDWLARRELADLRDRHPDPRFTGVAGGGLLFDVAA